VTPAQIEQLKKSWSQDPHWDLENTRGFEDHREELLAYRREIEARRRNESDQARAILAHRAGIDNNPALASELLDMQRRFDAAHRELERRIEAIENELAEQARPHERAR
jgi:uncharacterized protein YPO0396